MDGCSGFLAAAVTPPKAGFPPILEAPILGRAAPLENWPPPNPPIGFFTGVVFLPAGRVAEGLAPCLDGVYLGVSDTIMRTSSLYNVVDNASLGRGGGSSSSSSCLETVGLGS
jgi:hypothetical protein